MSKTTAIFAAVSALISVGYFLYQRDMSMAISNMFTFTWAFLYAKDLK